MLPTPSPMDCLSAFVVVFALGVLTAMAVQRMSQASTRCSANPHCPHAGHAS